MMIKGHSRTSDSQITSNHGTLNLEGQSPNRRMTLTTQSTTFADRDRIGVRHPARKTAPPQIRLPLGEIEEVMTFQRRSSWGSHSRSGSEYSLLGEQIYTSPVQDKPFSDLMALPPDVGPRCSGLEGCEEGAGDVASAKVVRLSLCITQ